MDSHELNLECHTEQRVWIFIAPRHFRFSFLINLLKILKTCFHFVILGYFALISDKKMNFNPLKKMNFNPFTSREATMVHGHYWTMPRKVQLSLWKLLMRPDHKNLSLPSKLTKSNRIFYILYLWTLCTASRKWNCKKKIEKKIKINKYK